jgi:bifunctional UDP-N-acetylglucosamine pyrophosphorylase/glucosamine-1-phosphate N-acetyltransferase
MKITAILLAAGQGTRMKSSLPKGSTPGCRQALDLACHAGHPKIHNREKPIVVVGHGAEEVTKYLGDSAQTVLQEPQLGTGHAVMQAESY